MVEMVVVLWFRLIIRSAVLKPEVICSCMWTVYQFIGGWHDPQLILAFSQVKNPVVCIYVRANCFLCTRLGSRCVLLHPELPIAIITRLDRNMATILKPALIQIVTCMHTSTRVSSKEGVGAKWWNPLPQKSWLSFPPRWYGIQYYHWYIATSIGCYSTSWPHPKVQIQPWGSPQGSNSMKPFLQRNNLCTTEVHISMVFYPWVCMTLWGLQ